MIMREEIGSGEYIDPKGRLFLRSVMLEYSYIDDAGSIQDHFVESFDNLPKWKRLSIDTCIYLLLAGIIVLGIIL